MSTPRHRAAPAAHASAAGPAPGAGVPAAPARPSNELLLRALRREPTPRRPIWLMRQAGRYLPEYRALRERASFEQCLASPELAAEIALQPIERFGFDGAIVFADLVSPLAALGLRHRFAPGPVLERPLRSAADIRALAVPEAGAIAPEVAATLRLVKERLAAGAALIGFAGAPWSLAAYCVESAGSKHDFARLRALAAEDERSVGLLLEKLALLAARYLVAQHRAGADVVQVFESWAGLLSERDWTRLVQPHLKTLLDELGRAGVPRILFANGAPHLARAYGALPCECLALCWRSDLAVVRRWLDPGKAVQGNLDPAVLLAGPEATSRGARELLARVPARGHVVNLGHGILPETPLESVDALISAVHAEDPAREGAPS